MNYRFPLIPTIIIMVFFLLDGIIVYAEEPSNPPLSFQDKNRSDDQTIVSNPLDDIVIDVSDDLNITNPLDNIVIDGPDDLNVTDDIDIAVKSNITNFTQIGRVDKPSPEDREKTGYHPVITGTKTGIKSSPVLVTTGVQLGVGKVTTVVPQKIKTGGNAGVSAITSFLGGAVNRVINPSPIQTPNESTGPNITPGHFLATTVLSSILMVIASLFSSRFGRGNELLLVAPMYSRLSRDEILHNPTREHIYSLVANNPGMDLLSIKNALNLTNGVLAHHIYTLEREKYLRSVRDGRYRRFYVNGTKIDRGSTIERLILKEIENHPMINQSQLAKKLDISRQAINYHIQKLVKKGLITAERNGRETLCKRGDS